VLAALFLMLLAPRAHAGCSLSKIWEGAFRETIHDVALDGDAVWAATSWGVSLYDASVDPPRALRSIAIPGTTRRVAASGGLAWLASGSDVVTVRADDPIRIESTVDVGSTIVDLIATPSNLYAATPAGVIQLDLFDPEHPSVARTIVTSSGGATSLTRIGTTIYVAQGTGVVDVISVDVPSIPQGIGTIDTLPAASAVTSDGASRIVISDGRRSEVFEGAKAAMNRIAVLDSVGASAAFFASPDLLWAAGQDSTIRAVDLEDASNPSILFEERLVPTAGTSNRIERIRGSGNRLVAAAGDIGLATWNLASFHAPFGLHGYRTDAISSVVAAEDRVWSAGPDGGIAERAMDVVGRLTPARSWLEGHVAKIHDVREDRLLVSEGGRLTLWDLASATPAALSTVQFGSPIRSAVFDEGSGSAWVVLDDATLWRADLSAATGSATASSLVGTFSMVERRGDATALVEFRDDGTTRIRYASSGDLESASSSVVDLDGFATSSVALGAGGRAAAVTYRGLYLIDFGSASAALAGGENPFPSAALHFAGSDVAVLRDDTLELRDGEDGHLVRSFNVSSGSGALGIGGASGRIGVVGSDEGLTTIDFDSDSGLPDRTSESSANRYFSAIVSGGGFIALYDGLTFATFRSVAWGLDRPGRTLEPGGGVVDVARTATRECALYGSSIVRCFDATGTIVGERRLEEGADALPLAIHAVDDALWVSISSGCLSGTCRNDVIVLDATSDDLAETDRFDGRIVAVTTAENRVWAISEFPPSIRSWTIDDPLHPALAASAPSEGNPVSLAYDSDRGVLYTLGSTVVAWSASLAKLGTLLDPWVADPSGRLAYVDQRIGIVDGCAVISGRTFDPRFYEIGGATAWSEAPGARSASPAKKMAIEGGRVHLLSDQGLEIWAVPAPVRRRAVGR